MGLSWGFELEGSAGVRIYLDAVRKAAEFSSDISNYLGGEGEGDQESEGSVLSNPKLGEEKK